MFPRRFYINGTNLGMVSEARCGRVASSNMSMAERRARNRSLCSLLCTPPAYPGYTSCLGSLRKEDRGVTSFIQYGEKTTCSDDFTRSVSLSRQERCSRGSQSPPLCSPEDDSEYTTYNDVTAVKKSSQAASGSSGYGSAASEESDPEISQGSPTFTPPAPSVCVESRSRAGKYKSRQDREADHWRRRSVPASLRNTLPDDVIRVLSTDGHCNYETDVDSGLSISMEVRGMRRPESVMQLARRFGEIGAAQENDMHKSRSSLWDGKENSTQTKTRSGPSTPVRQVIAPSNGVGGIASLRAAPTMSRQNMFKQMEKVGAGNAGPPRPMNPNSIKDALLRWVQSRLQGYPTVSVTNFSSSWADGMAFCALIHRFAPQSFDFSALDPKNRRENFELAFKVAEDHGVCQLLEVDDMIMMGDRPDWKCVFTYVQGFYKQFRDRP